MTEFHHDRIIILDFGGQYTHLIARKIREHGVYAEILPYHTPIPQLEKHKLKGIVLSGGPHSVYKEQAPSLPKAFLNWQNTTGIPVLGICYGMQLLAKLLGGVVTATNHQEFGLQTLHIETNSKLLATLQFEEQVLMSHGDWVQQLPKGFSIIGKTETCPIAAFENNEKHLYGVQFHPEVHHTLQGGQILHNFLFEICHCKPTWQVIELLPQMIETLRKTVRKKRVIMGVSGGIDSTVAAILLQKAIGDQLHAVFIDNGLLRKGEVDKVKERLAPLFPNFHFVDASRLFLHKLKGITAPEQKRQIIGSTFVEVFQHTASQLTRQVGPFSFLGQGTIAPDRIESGATSSTSSRIKSHHNVALPETLRLTIVEPLQLLYKDEVRKIGEQLGLLPYFIQRHPFPGPGLAVRILGSVTARRLHIVRESDAILTEELEHAGILAQLWQAFTIFLPLRTVGVMGDSRTYEYAIAIRIVESEEAMTARIAHIDWNLLERIGTRIINEVRGVNRVLYDLSNKPPATIEFL